LSWTLGDWYEVDEKKQRVDFGDEVKHTERNDLLFAEKVMLVDEPV